MTTPYKAWIEDKRPVYSRLPDCYKDNNVADILTIFWDELLLNLKDKIDDLPRQLDPNLCDEAWLDVLAPLCGFSGEYWDKTWATASKRILLANSYSLIWRDKGTEQVLSFILNALNIEHKIWSGSSFVLGVSQVSVNSLGLAAWAYKILLPTKYSFGGYEFKLAERINKLFGPVWCESEVTYITNVIPLFTYPMAAADDQTFITSDDGELLQF